MLYKEHRFYTINGTLYTFECCGYGRGTNGFAHSAGIAISGEYTKEIVEYLNRTWEKHPFDTVIARLAKKISQHNGHLAADMKIIRDAIHNGDEPDTKEVAAYTVTKY